MKRFLLVLLYAVFSSALFAQTYSVKQMVFLPPVFYVGDEVELRLTLLLPVPLENIGSIEKPQAEWIHFHSISAAAKGYEADLIIKFSTYYPGTRTLPPLKLGAITVDNIKLHTSSVLTDKNKRLSGLRKQLFIPGTAYIIGFGAGFFILSPLVFLFIRRLISLGVKRAGERNRKVIPARRFFKALKALRDNSSGKSGRELFIVLSSILKEYFNKRLSYDFSALTSSEIAVLPKNIFPESDIRNELGSVLKISDLVKFAGIDIDQDDVSAVFDRAAEAVKRVEQLLAARENPREKT